jgi:signal transduction histidine kinase/DNA-binding response OmpR family regulator
MLDDSAIRESDALQFLAGGGELGERMRAFDWSKTTLGSPAQWPKSLRTCVRIVLTSRQPMFVWWGSDLINLYNDAYKAIVGGKHPEALGQPASVVWREIWDEVGPRADSVITNNVGTYDEALLLIMERNGYAEETYYTFSYSPVPNDDDTTGGLICANSDDTQRIIGERQLATLRDVAAHTVDSRSAAHACLSAAAALGPAARDLPFCLIYSVDPAETTAVLMGASGIAPGHGAAPTSFDLKGASFQQAREALATQQIQLVTDLRARFDDLPQGPWDVPPSQAAVVPMPRSGQTGNAGLLVVGLNPYRLLDDAYRDFLNLLARQIAGSIASAEAYELERRRAEQLAEIDRAKTAFFSNVSHEFRTPLTLMLGPLEDAMQAQDQALRGPDLDTAHRNALRLLKLVNALLDFSRIEAGRSRATYVPTDLSALTADLASAFRSAIERAGLAFTVACPPLAEPIYVDHDMWERIVLNLLSNALKYTFEGSISVALTLETEQVALVVSDSGSGIPESELPHLFQRFHRVQGARSRTHEGSGIGLALVHELVRLHGGSIRVESRLGQGSRFTVLIPRGSSHLPQELLGVARPSSASATGAAPFVQEAFRWLPNAPGPDDPSETGSSPVTGLSSPEGAVNHDIAHDARIRILVVDDNADMREYVTRLLRQRWSVDQAADGAQALEAVRSTLPDLVLTDVMMPNLDGFGLLRELRADPATANVPVIMLSARAGEESRVEGLEAGADDYLVKPFAARELLARVTTHLQIAALRGEAVAERERLHAIFMQAPVPVAVLTGPELRFEVANDPYCEMVGRNNLAGMSLREAFAEPGARAAVEQLEQAFRARQPLTVAELSVKLLRNGVESEGFFSYVAQPFFDALGNTDGIIVAATELTDSVLARRRTDSLRKVAEQANRAKDEFLSTLSHELRTPLNAMIGWSTLLRAGSVPAAQRDKALETIERNARVQARLVEDMLDLARIEQGKLILSVGPLELVRVVDAAIEAVKPAAEAKQIRLQPVLDSHATIVGDADRLQQVVWNLLSNAIKFTPRGGRVQVRLRREPSFVEVVVADNGQGIEPEFLPHIFDRFRQADASFTRRAGGLGLGLAIVRSLVELHGGDVSALSDGPGRGTTFVVRLPMAPLRADNRPSATLDQPGEPKAHTFECPPSLKGLKILVVDDEPETRELLQFLLEQCESVVSTAGNAPQALALLEREQFDVLISDVGMPDEDGYSLIKRVRGLGSVHAALPALALTAYARAEDRTQALRAGFNMHLAKPIDPGELLVVIETLVRNLPLRS